MTIMDSKLWALVLDSNHARLLKGLEEDRPPPEIEMHIEAHKLRDIMSDKPGRSFSSTGEGRRSAIEYGSDPLREEEKDFLRKIIAELEDHREAGEIERLAIFAEPRMLGLLRTLLPASLGGLVVHEKAINLVHVAPHDLPKVLRRHLETSE
ncbi:host attachment protein [Cereibacter sphaeroides]|uniref:host attachment protein n=1 Tax=Cereibacter sphaeroides TaxID=1063 RepID=UPI001F1E6397|nr:host attachment protein [Cereibacter sphaeroides]MCE6953115.1 host attachment protein [Cereibacter sphaeroides]